MPTTQQMLSYMTHKLSSRPLEAIQYPDHDSDAEYWAGMQTLISEEEDEPEDILDHVEEQQRGLVVMVSINFHTYDDEEQCALMSQSTEEGYMH